MGRLTAQVNWLGLRVGGHPALSLYSLNKTGELSERLRPSWQHHKNCPGIIITHIIVVVIIHFVTMTKTCIVLGCTESKIIQITTTTTTTILRWRLYRSAGASKHFRRTGGFLIEQAILSASPCRREVIWHTSMSCRSFWWWSTNLLTAATSVPSWAECFTVLVRPRSVIHNASYATHHQRHTIITMIINVICTAP